MPRRPRSGRLKAVGGRGGDPRHRRAGTSSPRPREKAATCLVLALLNCVQFSPHLPPNRPSILGSLIFIDDRRGALNRLDRSLTLEGGPRGRPWCRGGDSRSPSRLPRSSHLRLLAILDKPSYELNFGPALSSVHEIMCLLVILWPIFSRSLNELI